MQLLSHWLSIGLEGQFSHGFVGKQVNLSGETIIGECKLEVEVFVSKSPT